MPQKRLLILDLNGTILHRFSHVSETKSFRNHPVVINKNLQSDITIHGSKVVFRPHARTFLEHALKHFDVAVWTSSRPKNALPMVHHSFYNLLDFSGILAEAKPHCVTTRQILLGPSDKAAEQLKKLLVEETKGSPKLKFIWTQNECDVVVPVEASVGSSKFVKPVRKKDLTKVYTKFPEYSPENTLIIDDTNEKLADHVENHLLIDEFNVINCEIDFTADSSLLKLIRYLDKLLMEDPVDLRPFLSRNNIKDF